MDVGEVVDIVNSRISDCFYSGSSDSVAEASYEQSSHPYVCIICDIFVSHAEIEYVPLKTLKSCKEIFEESDWNKCESVRQRQDYLYKGRGRKPWMESMFLSPRGCYVTREQCDKGSSRKGRDGYFVTCRTCHKYISERSMPPFAIANNFLFGTAPSCLTDLTEVELALLTPVKSYGFLFAFSGGRHTKLKGCITFLKISTESIGRVVAHFEALELNNDIVIVLNGEMTEAQKKRAKGLCQVRTSKVIEAVKFLQSNSKLWKHVRLESLVSSLRNPVVVDRAVEVENETSDDSGSTDKESFVVYFPDGTMHSVFGGYDNIEEFTKAVREAKRAQQSSLSNIVVEQNLSRELASEFEGDTYVSANLLQFPYGRGGMKECRMTCKGVMSHGAVLVGDYLKHVSSISQPHFHRALFILINYNMYQRHIMLHRARFSLGTKVDVSNLSNLLNADDLDRAILTRRAGLQYNGTSTSSRYLNSIMAVTKALPHSNEAAKVARTEMFAMNHAFGTAHYFLTVTPDDETSWLMQVFSQQIIDDAVPVCELNDNVLKERASLRKKLRLDLPGIAAKNFEIVFDIICNDVIRYNLKEQRPCSAPGLFGTCVAMTATVEEQGRTTLHVHFQIWVKEMFDICANMASTDRGKAREAATKMCIEFDRIASTELVTGDDHHADRMLKKLFGHGCVDKLPELPSCQDIRNKRHQVGCRLYSNVASCSYCGETWSAEKVVEQYLQCIVNVPGLTSYPEPQTQRLNSIIVNYQKQNGNEVNATVVNAVYNCHRSCHVASCFKQGCSKRKFIEAAGEMHGGKRTKLSGDGGVECRMRLPDYTHNRTVIARNVESTTYFSWTGEKVEQHCYDMIVQRKPYDWFQNVSCRVFSESVLACNSNVRKIVPGPMAVYVTKYNSKGTQEEEVQEYAQVSQVTRKMLQEQERKYDSDRSEAVRRLLRGSFAHNSNNVISAPLARWLTVHGTRFLFSHKFAWVSLKEMQKVLSRNPVTASVVTYGKQTFFEHIALHYLCRPDELENENLYNITAQFEIVKNRNGTKDELLQFVNTQHYQHPSYIRSKHRMSQAMQRRGTSVLVKLHQWEFNDTALFGGSILDEGTTITDEIEAYSMYVLMLFYPYRCNSDLFLDGSCTKKLRLVFNLSQLDDMAQRFLQNVQDSRANHLRMPRSPDWLEQRTVMFNMEEHAQAALQETATPEVEQDQPNIVSDDVLEEWDNLLQDEMHCSGSHSLSLSMQRRKGSHKCGYNNIASVSQKQVSAEEPFVASSSLAAIPEEEEVSFRELDIEQQSIHHEIKIEQADIVRVIFRWHNDKHEHQFSNRSRPVLLHAANGSPKSIVLWGKETGLDKGQRHAFEIIVSAFVLSYFADTVHGNVADRATTVSFNRARRALLKLSRARGRNEQLLMCLHGPAGSGKSTLLDIVSAYAKEYCEAISVPYNENTIVLTAMSGVAATLIKGDTTHASLHLMKKNGVPTSAVNAWRETKLLVVDEISFATKRDFTKIDANLRILKQCTLKPFGGLNVIFAGDFRQLAPPSGDKPIYEDDTSLFHMHVNCFIELDGMHRFKDDIEHGYRLMRFRNGTVTHDDINYINSKCVVSPWSKLPQDVQYATYYNRDRDAINTAVFEEHVRKMAQENNGKARDAVLILADDLKVKRSDGTYGAFLHPKLLWEGCGEDHITTSSFQGRVDPTLKVYPGCPVMLTSNISVRKGKANGTRATVERVVLKPGGQAFDIELEGVGVVSAVYASQVQEIVCKPALKGMDEGLFSVRPGEYNFKAKVPKPASLAIIRDDRERMDMKGLFFPIVSNHATTGHKLQGCSVDKLYVHCWNYRDRHWPYVLLSRVRTLKGLYCREPLDTDLSKYEVPLKLKEMLEQFSRLKPHELTDQEYDDLEIL